MSELIHILIGKSTTALLAPYLNVFMNRARNQHLPWELELRGGVEIEQDLAPPLTQNIWPVCSLFR